MKADISVTVSYQNNIYLCLNLENDEKIALEINVTILDMLEDAGVEVINGELVK